MIDKKQAKNILKKQGYRIIEKNSAIKVCSWTRKSLTNQGVCYKEQFYGIKSHLCAQISCALFNCQNKCIHCWRNLDYTELPNKNEIDNPKEIIDGCIKAQQKLLTGFNGNSKTNKNKLAEAQEPMQFAISLTGEPTLYPKLGEMINELRSRGKTSFVVTNGLQPEVLSKLNEEGNLPTQLYVSLNSPNEELFNKWHRSQTKDAWQKLNQTLELFPKLKTRKVIRMTLVKGKNNNMNDGHIREYSELIKLADPDFIEVKGYMSVGFARNREGMGYDSMPMYDEVQEFAKKIAEATGLKILDEHEFSRVVLVGKDKKRMKIQKNQI